MGFFSNLDVEIGEYVAMGMKNKTIIARVKKDYPDIPIREINECIKSNRKAQYVAKPRRIK